MGNVLRESLRKNGWSRIPECAWMVTDEEGNARCGYKPVQVRMRALNVAQYTLFDQSYVDTVIEKLVENRPADAPDLCSPETCPRWYTRLANRIQK